MNDPARNALILATVLIGICPYIGAAQYPDWKHSGSVWILTTPEGADLPATARESDFPVLVRLHKDFFDFRQAAAGGEDLRFSTSDGKPLAYQIDEWDPAGGHASVWVRVPTIQGNARQELRLFWGKPDANSESSGKAVFNESNGYLSVAHLGDTIADEVGTLTFKDVGATVVPGMVGRARHLAGKQGLFAGDKLTSLPSGGEAHSTEAWFRAEKPNATLFGWGNEGGGRGCKVCLQFRSPPHIHVDSDFSDVDAPSRLPMGEWVHVIHTYKNGEGRIYINGRLDGAAKQTLNIKSPARLWIGGWYHNYTFVGDVDEARISKAARSPDWIRLQYENQKLHQTLVGPLVQPGNDFGVSKTEVVVPEGAGVTLTAKAGGAQKLFWIVKRDGRETVAATDRLSFTFDAGRVVGDQPLVVRLKAIYADEIKSKDIAVTIREAIPEPVFTLTAPKTWDGRETIEVVPQVSNAKEMGATKLNYQWSIADLATIKEVAPGKLILKRAQNSGPMVVTAKIDNGGAPTTRSITIAVTEPARDAWVPRTPAKDEMPEDNQFYARDAANEGTLVCNGTLAEPADTVFVRLFADDKPAGTLEQKPKDDRSYAFSIKLKPGLIKYRVEFGVKTDGRETVLKTAGNLVCGDAYLINGQSNAVATDFGKDDPAFRSDWIRTFGSMSGNPKGVRIWGNALHRNRDAEKLQIGYWGMELGRRLVENHKIPICLINGAVGGTRIDQHQRNDAEPEDMTTIYGRLLWRTRQARLTHGIRGVIWHQGENDQGADGPTGGFGWETYRQFFVELAADWKQDYPNIQHYYLFQIWPKSCAMGINGSDNRLREVQRSLPTAFSRMSLMSTLGIDPPGGCHFPAAGYAEFARLICPLIERDHYGTKPTVSITPPNLKRAFYADEKKDEIVLEFDQPVTWNNNLTDQFFLDGEKGKVASGSAVGGEVRLRLTAPASARTITYLDSASWSQAKLLRGDNGIAALTFCETPILSRPR